MKKSNTQMTKHSTSSIGTAITKNPALAIAAVGAACYAGSYLTSEDSQLHDKLRIGGAMAIGIGVGSFATQALNGNMSAEKFALIDRQNEALRNQADILASIAKITGVANTVQSVQNK
ncbi:MAG: hypothetical protein NC548_06385 [Lachnospiraceae bacterium]|nr:hypothetical protein [Lachnospiraceae bacterium]